MPKLRVMNLENASRPRYGLEYEVREGTAKHTWRNEDTSSPSEEDALVREVALQHTGGSLEVEFKEW